MSAIVPILGRSIKGIVIPLTLLLNNSFKTDISPDLIPGSVKKDQGNEPSHATVAIGKGMNTQEVQNICRNKE
jgi:hypothetical protein